MKRVVTAIGEKYINEKLSKENQIEIIGNDIQYEEAIFEIIKNNKIDFLIINENIFNNLEIIKNINKIKIINKKIKIIIIINNQKNIIKNLKNKKNIFIIINNQKNHKKIKENQLLKMINEIILDEKKDKDKKIFEVENTKTKNQKFYKTSKYLKNILSKRRMKIFKSYFMMRREKEKQLQKRNTKKQDSYSQIITIIDNENLGNSNILEIISKENICRNNENFLIVDLNNLNQVVYSKFKKRKYPSKIYQRIITNNYNKDRPISNQKKYRNLNKEIKCFYLKNPEKIFEDFLIKINNNINLISNLDLIMINNKKIINKIIINNLINERNKNNYKKIIIYTNNNNEINSFLFNLSLKILLIIKSEISEIKQYYEIIKSIEEKNKIIIYLKKYNRKSVSYKIVKKIFKHIKIIKKNFNRNLYKKMEESLWI